MLHHILVPVDGTTRADEAVDVARHLAARAQASIVLLHVQERTSDVRAVVSTNQDLEQRVAALRAEGLDARHFIGYGNLEETIAATASEQRADLIVMAPHHRGRLEGLRHPSLTARVLANAPAPVLVWPENAPGRAYFTLFNTAGAAVVVPLDGSDLAERALPVAVAFVREFSSPLLLLRVVPPPSPVTGGPEPYSLMIDYELNQEREARHYLASVRKRLPEDQTLTIHSMVLRGLPEHELLRVAETHNGSIMVMSTHGRGSLGRIFMGSVATSVMCETPLPLVVVSPHVVLDGGVVATATTTTDDQRSI